MGARPYADGPSAIHSHMTNTLNAPIEAFDYVYPLRVVCYEIRKNSGGSGRFAGGDGIIREIETFVDSHVTLLTERRRFPPYGLSGGGPGSLGENLIIKGKNVQTLPGKGKTILQKGDKLVIKTPGEGGYGKDR